MMVKPSLAEHRTAMAPAAAEAGAVLPITPLSAMGFTAPTPEGAQDPWG